MAKIDERDKETIRNMFSEQMKGTTHIRFFSSKENCDYCEDTQEILEELAALTDNIDLQIFDKDENADEVSRYDVDKFPAILFIKEDGSDTGVRFYGIPSGYEFSSLIEDIIDIANDKTGLSQSTIEQLKSITQDVKISVFVTPT
ncbi:thioredoxin domain-containing protein [Tepidibacillus marianensis]|uniref:thioredoxin domain-containing protein n=1 Tax=Tepidibacillus marianensis TaxID=3131995 RepID=UPI0030CEEE02